MLSEKELDQYAALARKKLDGSITPEEENELSNWLQADDGNDLFIPSAFVASESELKKRLQKSIEEEIHHSAHRSLYKKLLVAATLAFVVVLGIGVWHQQSKNIQASVANGDSASHDVAPGSAAAVLTLASGQKIFLDSAGNGLLAHQNGVSVSKNKDGRIVYKGASNTVSYNTLNAPRGSRPVHIVLADGTLVWLNVGSSITFPTAFIGPVRQVKVDGEAYFEVTKDEKHPFIVTHNKMEVKVLGTHFDVKAFEDEDIHSVTLLEGCVQASKGKSSVLIKPAEQAQFSNTNDQIHVKKSVDINEITAWMNGKFQFGDHMDIQSIMKEISRWYDMDVAYQGKIDVHIGGTISRYVNVSQVLALLEETDVVKFSIEGKKIIVTAP